MDVLDTDRAGHAAIRGGTLRGIGYGAGLLLSAASVPIVVRYLGLVDFGRFVLVTALIGAALGGDSSAVADAHAGWTAIAYDIAAFLWAANPRSWPLAYLMAMLHDHLALTTEEALARLHGDWDADVAAYDEIHVQALGMADMLSTGIIRQFPSRFH